MQMIHNVLAIGISLIVAVAIVVLAGIRDTTIPEKKFDCRLLIGGWHPDVPKNAIEKCRKGVPNDYSSKTNY
jgi:hypothetical protein